MCACVGVPLCVCVCAISAYLYDAPKVNIYIYTCTFTYHHLSDPCFLSYAATALVTDAAIHTTARARAIQASQVTSAIRLCVMTAMTECSARSAVVGSPGTLATRPATCSCELCTLCVYRKDQCRL